MNAIQQKSFVTLLACAMLCGNSLLAMDMFIPSTVSRKKDKAHTSHETGDTSAYSSQYTSFKDLKKVGSAFDRLGISKKKAVVGAVAITAAAAAIAGGLVAWRYAKGNTGEIQAGTGSSSYESENNEQAAVAEPVTLPNWQNAFIDLGLAVLQGSSSEEIENIWGPYCAIAEADPYPLLNNQEFMSYLRTKEHKDMFARILEDSAFTDSCTFFESFFNEDQQELQTEIVADPDRLFSESVRLRLTNAQQLDLDLFTKKADRHSAQLQQFRDSLSTV